LDQEAAVGGDEEDEEEEAESGDELTEREAEKLRQENLYKPRTRTSFEDMLARDTDQHIEDRYRAMARASAHRTQDFYEAGGAGPRQSEVTKQSLLPTPGVDACMWRVKVKKNQEQAMVMSVMDMARKLAAKRQRVGITAAVFAGTKGHILIEARNEADAAEAVRCNSRFVLSQRLEVVEYRYMPHSLAVSEKIAPKPLKTGQWVRFKRGLYKGDLCRVIAILEGGSKVVIEMVPRINYEDMARPNTRAGNIYIVSSAARPSQKFFSAAEAREQGVVLHRMKHPGLNLPCDVACNLHYLNGYLVKEVKPEALQTENVNATVEEVTKFGLGALSEEEDGRGHEERLEAAQRQVEETQEAQRQILRVFEPGDTVRITKGEAAGVVGKVLGSDPTRGTVQVRPLQAGAPGMPAKLDVQAHELCNHVAVGQHVKVLDGMFAGETGMVQALLEEEEAEAAGGEPVVSILTDGENKEIRVRLGQVKESAEVASGLSSLQGYALHDMVCFGYQRFGVVVWLGRESVQVLDSSGVVQTLPVGELQGNFNRRSRQTVAYDSMNNRIQVDDQVTVTDRGEHFQKRGTIKHIMGGTLWVHTKQEPRNAGVFVARAGAVALQNLLRRSAVQFNQLNTAAVPGMGMGMAGPGMGGGGFGGGGRSFGGGGRGGGGRGFGPRANMDPLVGKFVRIRGKSEFKGQCGTVRSVKENVVFVDLETGTRPKTVRVDRAAVAEEVPGGRAGAAAGGGGYGGPAAATPAWMGGRTPMHGGATPMHGAATPMHLGGQTPSLYGGAGGQTPAYQSGSYTPRHQYE
jgi:transcription elongation factor SPT5